MADGDGSKGVGPLRLSAIDLFVLLAPALGVAWFSAGRLGEIERSLEDLRRSVESVDQSWRDLGPGVIRAAEKCDCDCGHGGPGNHGFPAAPVHPAPSGSVPIPGAPAR